MLNKQNQKTMKTTYKILLILFLIPIAINANDLRGKYSKKKVLTKEYTVNKNATLNISNKYGNIDIVSNNSDKIEITVTITTSGDNEEKVQDKLNDIDVEFNGNSTNVSAKTLIGRNSSSWSSWGKRNNVSFEINYVIKMPVSNNVYLNNDYGSIHLDKLEGSAEINCDYGKILIGELMNSNNSINIDYTNKSNIDYMKNGDINADYSSLHIEKADRVTLNADYSHLSFGTVENIDYNCDYGDLKIDECSTITGNNDYMHTSIGLLKDSAIFSDVDYGSIKINELSENFKEIDIKSSYTQIKIGVKPSNSFNVTASLGYGNLKSGDNFTFNKEIVKSSSKYYEGYYNSPNSSSTINLKTSYGNITFNNH